MLSTFKKFAVTLIAAAAIFGFGSVKANAQLVATVQNYQYTILWEDSSPSITKGYITIRFNHTFYSTEHTSYGWYGINATVTNTWTFTLD